MRSLILIRTFLLYLSLSVPFSLWAQRESAQTGTDSRSPKYYIDLVKKFRYNNPDTANYYAVIGLDLAIALRDSSSMADMINQQGMLEDNNGRYLSSGQKYSRSLTIYRQIQNKKGEAATLVRLGVVELRKGNYDRAIAYFLQALKASESIKDFAGIMEAQVTLGEVFLKQGAYEKSLEYLKTAEKLDEDLPFSSLRLNLFNNLGAVYKGLKHYDLAISYLKKGIKQSQRPGMEGLNITLNNTLAGVYTQRGKYQDAINILNSSLVKSKHINNYIRELQTLLELSELYKKTKTDSSVKYLNLALKLAQEKKSYKQQIDILNTLSTYYSSQKNFEKAYHMKEKSQALSDSFYYQDMSREIINLQAEYELDKSKVRLKDLQIENRKQQFERNVILALAAAMIFIIIVISYYYLRTRKLNALLNKSNEDLKESNDVKDKLFSIIAHDLRMPLTTAVSILPLLNDEEATSQEREEIVDTLVSNFTTSLDTLNQLLRWGEMQIKGVSISPSNFDAGVETARVLSFLGSMINTKRLTIANRVSSPIVVFADIDHVHFVLRNLISNAIKFTPEGGTISLEVIKKSGFYVFSVIDTGVGIAAERIDTIFTIKNSSTPGTNNEKGTSLGLVMCREFVEKNGGEISVRSSDQGSVFSFSLPQGNLTSI